MAQEAVLRDRLAAEVMDFTVADGTGIEKGTVLKMTDPRTAAASAAAGDVLSGIAMREKIADDGRTRLSVCRGGAVFDMYASGSIALGSPVASVGTLNEVISAVGTNYSGASILGYALETASDLEQFQVYVSVGGGKN